MEELKWCLVELESILVNAGWVILQRSEPKLEGHKFGKWRIEKNGEIVLLEFYHDSSKNPPAIYSNDLFIYACKIKGTDIGLSFLEYYQKHDWMKLLSSFIQTLDRNYNLPEFGGHAIDELAPNEAIEIAKLYLQDQTSIDAKNTGIYWRSGWMDGTFKIDNQVWIVKMTTLNDYSSIECGTTLHVVVSWKTGKVEDYTY